MLPSQGMGPARLAVAADQRLLVGFEEQHRCLEQAAQRRQDLRQLIQTRAFADVHHQCCPLNLQRVEYKFSEVADESNWQVIHAVVAEVLKGLQGRGFSRSAHARDDDQLVLVAAMRRDRLRLRVSASRAGPSCGTFGRRHCYGLPRCAESTRVGLRRQLTRRMLLQAEGSNCRHLESRHWVGSGVYSSTWHEYFRSLPADLRCCSA